MRIVSFFRNLTSLLLWFVLMASGRVALADPPTNLQLYILMGQSNMVGQDPRLLNSQVDHPNVLSFNDSKQWVVAHEPLRDVVGGIGPGIPFALEMLNSDPTATIGLIPCAVSGTGLKE